MLIHGVEKMMLAQNFSDHYFKIKNKSNFQILVHSDFDANIQKNKLLDLKNFENYSRVICCFQKYEQNIEINIDLSINNLITFVKLPFEFSINKVYKTSELKFEDIDTILVTHKKMDYKLPTTIKINVSGHNCLHEIKSLKNFLLRLDRDAVYKIGKKPYAVNELICNEDMSIVQNSKSSSENKYFKKTNKITKFYLIQYNKYINLNIVHTFYYIELEIQNNKTDFRLLSAFLKGIGSMKNIFLVNFNINILEEQYQEMFVFLEKNKHLWFQNKYLTTIKLNQNCEILAQSPKSDFKDFLNRRKVAFLQAVTIENLRIKKELKFRKEICQDILNYLI